MTAIIRGFESRAPMHRIVAASMIGTTIEWYDFFLYGTAAALVFNHIFFPAADALTGAMMAFGTYALGFLARPLGGIVFGHFGDRIGRKTLLIISMIMMGGATTMIGLLPTYAQIGVAAPALLIVLRIVQGFAVGGEWGGAVLLVAEHGDAARRGFWTSWPQAGVSAGNVLAAAVLALMAAVQEPAAFLDWGWRIPFLLSSVLVGVGFWIRISVEESRIFTVARECGTISAAPVKAALLERPLQVLVGTGARIAENLSFYILAVFSITYAVDVVHVDRSIMLNAALTASGAEFLCIPLFAALSDRVGRRPVMLFGIVGIGLWTWAFFPLVATGSPPLIFAAMIIGLILHAAMYGPQAAFLAELFPTRFRYSGMSLASQLSSVLAGSVAPIVAIALLRHFGTTKPIAMYVAAGSLLSSVAVLASRETRSSALSDD